MINEFVQELNLIESAGLSYQFIAKELKVTRKNVLDWRDGKNLPSDKLQAKYTGILRTSTFWDENY